MAEAVPYPTVYGFWTNKGGVGKTTLSFHIATTYAELFPKKTVVAIDMCPQTNFSATLLTNAEETIRISGDEVVAQLQDKEKAEGPIPKTIGGYLMARLSSATVPVEKFLTSVDHYNTQVPPNLKLVCGDSNLELLAPRLSSRAREESNEILNDNPFKDVHYFLRAYIQKLAEYYANLKEPDFEELVVFIDTNPALSIYTEIALCAMTELVMPVCADTFSLQAVNRMYHLVYGLYPTSNKAAQGFEKDSFAQRVKKNNMSLPAITAIIHNRNPIIKENGQERAETTKANKAMAAEQCDRLYDGYEKAKKNKELQRVFVVKKDKDNNPIELSDPVELNNIKKFAQVYTATMRDVRSCGVASLHSGFPLWKLLEKYRWIDKQFKDISFNESVPGLMKDLLFAMEDMLGPAHWAGKDADAYARLDKVATVPGKPATAAAAAVPENTDTVGASSGPKSAKAVKKPQAKKGQAM